MAPQLIGVRPFHGARFGKLFDRPGHLLIPNSGAHLERLDEKLRFDHAARAGFEIEFIGGAAAITSDPFEHRVDLSE